MLKINFLLILVLGGSVLSIAQEKFSLSGEIAGNTRPFIYLSYTGSDGIRVDDSTKIINSKFVLKGVLAQPVMATLTTSRNKRLVDDQNRTAFYIEPGKLKITLKEDDFPNAIITGSKTQELYKKHTEAKSKIMEAMQPLEKEYEMKNRLYGNAENELRELEKKVKRLHEEAYDFRAKFAPFKQQMEELDLEFIKSNPNSVVSANLLQYRITKMPLSEGETLFNRLSESVQKSEPGKQIAQEIQKQKGGMPGNNAFVFNTTDINGKAISLNDFRGKYVLLDFWASWCVPCRRGNPHLISVYNKYKGKGFEIIGISDDDLKQEAWRKAVEQDQIQIWRHILRGLKIQNGAPDRSGDLIDKYGVHGLPTKILIDPKGVIIGKYAGGEENDQSLDKKLLEIFGS